MELEKIRKDIDRIDSQLVELLKREWNVRLRLQNTKAKTV